MSIGRTIRSIGWASLTGIGLAVLALPSAAAEHRMSPFVTVGPQAQPAQAGGAAPQQALFTCQLGFFEPDEACYDPLQMRHAYQIDSVINAGYKGAGRTIVIVDAFQSPTIVNDVDTFSANYGLPLTSSGYFTQVSPFGTVTFNALDPNMQGWSVEISLDVEYAHGIAPDANIVLVLAKTNDDQDIFNAVKYAVDNRLGDVISMSFGENESCTDPDLVSQYHALFAAATKQGITLIASAGDQGAAQQTCDGKSWVKAASHPASDPLVTAVGGSELHAAKYCLTALGCDPNANPAPGTYQGEITWNEPPGTVDPDNSLSTGGGFSVLFDAPAYQNGTIHGGKQRALPDVAYSAAVLHGVLVRWSVLSGLICNGASATGCFFLVGGTSAGSPQWSAITVIANQKAGHALGLLNPAIYRISQDNESYSDSFHDIISGNNSVIELDSSSNPVSVTGFSAGAGWDSTTGVGSPIDTTLVDYLIANVSAGDGQSVISTTKPKPHPKPIVPGHVDPH